MRSADLYISIATLQRLKAYATLTDLSSPDAAAELLLSESLKQYPAIDELLEAQDRARNAIKEKWKLEHGLNKPEPSVSEGE